MPAPGSPDTGAGSAGQAAAPAAAHGAIRIRRARVHNLRDVSLDIPRRALVVITGPSGSGKSSLAYDTLYAEGQRRYIESLSSFAHQFLEQLPKPDVERIEGLSPALAIDQRGLGSNPRSTVGTVTEIASYLRLLYARCGTQTCPECGVAVSAQPLAAIRDALASRPDGSRLWLLAPVVRGRKGAHRKLLQDLQRQGYVRAEIDGELVDLDDPPALAPGRRHEIAVVVDGLVKRPGARERLEEALDRALALGDGTVVVRDASGERTLFSRHAACPGCGRGFPPLEPRLFSFNSPAGSCPECQGLGHLPTILPETLVPDPSLSLRDGAVAYLKGRERGWLFTQVEALAAALGVGLDVPAAAWPDDFRRALFDGPDAALRERLREDPRYDAFLADWHGLVPELLRRHRETKAEKVRAALAQLLTPRPCPACGGYRLRPEALAVRVGGMHIGEVGDLPVAELPAWADALTFADPLHRAVAGPVLAQIRQRAGFLDQAGVGYLSLNRPVATLSGGEGQRVRLATQVGSRLTGVLYVLDEPSVGLHHRDIHRLIAILHRLRDRGNSVVVVEHDLDVMRAADHLVDLGPGAGRHGGKVVAQGPPAAVAAVTESVTGRWLAARDRRLPPAPLSGGAAPEHWLEMRGLTGRNLRGIDLRIPLNRLTVVTGVSGSGKSTAVHDTLYRELARRLNRATALRPEPFASLTGEERLRSVILVDQSPIGRSPRSTPATYTGLWTHVRRLLAAVPLAQLRGYGPARFSFNTGAGRCPACEGAGVRRLTMDFLPAVDVPCEECGGRRFNAETLEVRFKGHSAADLLDLPAEAALALLENIPGCRRILEVMCGVGLGYVTLGQAGVTLSGGESQRLKLTRELSRGGKGRSLFVLDEPTTGLHFCDVEKLLEIFRRLLAAGHTVLVIEHNPEIVRHADRIIDLGPEGGAGGGRIVAEGSVTEVAATAASYTGAMLRELLDGISPLGAPGDGA